MSDRAFRDSQGRRWRVRFTFDEAWRCAQAGIDVISNDRWLTDVVKIRGDGQAFADALWEIVKADAAEAGIDRPTFFASMQLEHIEAAQREFEDAIADFTSGTDRADLVRRAVEMHRAHIAEGLEQAGRAMSEAMAHPADSGAGPTSPGQPAS